MPVKHSKFRASRRLRYDQVTRGLSIKSAPQGCGNKGCGNFSGVSKRCGNLGIFRIGEFSKITPAQKGCGNKGAGIFLGAQEGAGIWEFPHPRVQEFMLRTDVVLYRAPQQQPYRDAQRPRNALQPIAFHCVWPVNSSPRRLSVADSAPP